MVTLGLLFFTSVAFAGYPGLEFKNKAENPAVSQYLASETYFEDLYSVHDLINFLQSGLVLKSVHLKISNSQNDFSYGRTDFKNHVVLISVTKDPAMCGEPCFRQILAKQLIGLVIFETSDRSAISR
jgi:hypothetical protein